CWLTVRWSCSTPEPLSTAAGGVAISEAGITGIGIGMAMRGYRPIVEIMFGDFITLCADQMINHASKFPWMYNGDVQVPLVIRTPMGGYRGYGPTHSQSLESLFMSIPHLTILSPSHLHDAGAMLSWAVLAQSGPLLFVENKRLYPESLLLDQQASRNETAFSRILLEPHDPAGVIRLAMAPDESPDVTLISYGGMSPLVLEAAHRAFMHEELLVDILLVGRLRPVPLEPLLPSVRASGRVLLVEEGPRTGGWGSEVASQLSESCFSELKAPIQRIGAADTPIPCARNLEAEILPSVDGIEQTLYKLAAIG
ncbi:MAG: alpha-ketoacid dehydrogenase subunit beta, partial [Magnetococcales bacterium]|nr:alpha-ketoacid dehydrogenase subunit beta [Magnetococcales bacterium]